MKQQQIPTHLLKLAAEFYSTVYIDLVDSVPSIKPVALGWMLGRGCTLDEAVVVSYQFAHQDHLQLLKQITDRLVDFSGLN